ncbi:hypothetical protein NL676_006415 [Syzygium grande]|nr:hypothetical protein NL676_006415 [Syzygium grande]
MSALDPSHPGVPSTPSMTLDKRELRRVAAAVVAVVEISSKFAAVSAEEVSIGTSTSGDFLARYGEHHVRHCGLSAI